jgi:prevent-host-death family protein
MSKPNPDEAQVMSAPDVRQHFGDVVNRVARGEGRVIVEKHGAPAVGIVSMDDVRRLRNRDIELKARREFVQWIREPFEDIPDDELRAEIDKALDEVKEDRKRERALGIKRQLVHGVGE